MNKGDIILFKNTNEVYIAYDKDILVGYGILGVKVKHLRLFHDREDIVFLRYAHSFSGNKRVAMGEFLRNLVCGRTRLSIKERINFLQYIVNFYKHGLNINIMDNIDTKIDFDSVCNSMVLIKINMDD